MHKSWSLRPLHLFWSTICPAVPAGLPVGLACRDASGSDTSTTDASMPTSCAVHFPAFHAGRNCCMLAARVTSWVTSKQRAARPTLSCLKLSTQHAQSACPAPSAFMKCLYQDQLSQVGQDSAGRAQEQRPGWKQKTKRHLGYLGALQATAPVLQAQQFQTSKVASDGCCFHT